MKAFLRARLGAYRYNARTLEVDTGGLRVQGHPRLHMLTLSQSKTKHIAKADRDSHLACVCLLPVTGHLRMSSWKVCTVNLRTFPCEVGQVSAPGEDQVS